MTPDTRYEFDLFVRSLEPRTAAPAHEDVAVWLDHLADDEQVSLEVRVWGDALPLTSPIAGMPAAEALREQVAEIRRWATERGVDLPGFEQVETDTLVGRPRTALRLPSPLVVASRDGEIVWVAPHLDGGRHRGVREVVGELLESPEMGPRAADIRP
ncbi:hypothetical protein N0B31_06450 [Salinirubellus salinus]|uniref:Uncharacterized protein n=1 Tax=Salinirubellus salinus TaxID=1364945 RepID=A0A9E7U9G5_9EURY|nr:HTH domain-containing protein [Salinirubellus salinus]UWM55921.1 hypothetical protein N0B31_06450 [Salinirubellus salinus]